MRSLDNALAALNAHRYDEAESLLAAGIIDVAKLNDECERLSRELDAAKAVSAALTLVIATALSGDEPKLEVFLNGAKVG